MNLLRAFLVPAMLLFAAVSPGASGERYLFRDQFHDLSDWQDFFFPKIARHSSYTAARCGDATCLRTESRASASALVHKAAFDVREYPRARWRWKVQNVYQKADPRRKSGDDYPIRIYVMFEYDPGKASAWERMQYRIAKGLYGQYPPHSSLSYVWSSKDDAARVLDSPYTDRAKMVLLEKGPSRSNTWQDEAVDMLADYREAFGAEPPARARIAVMNDSDDTGESAVSWVEYIEVYREEKD